MTSNAKTKRKFRSCPGPQSCLSSGRTELVSIIKLNILFYACAYSCAYVAGVVTCSCLRLCLLSCDPYGSASAFFVKPLMKVPYEGRTHLRERGRKKPYGPTTKAYGLASSNFKKICLQIGHMIKYLLTKLGRAGWENIWLSVNGARISLRSVRTP